MKIIEKIFKEFIKDTDRMELVCKLQDGFNCAWKECADLRKCF